MASRSTSLPSRPRRILIAGCGYVGTAAAVELAGRGHSVWGLRRDPGAPPPGVGAVCADLIRPGLAGQLPPGIEQVVFAAAPGGGPESAYRRLFVEGMQRLLDALAAGGHPVERLVLVSSTGVYGTQTGAWVDEDTEPSPELASGRVMVEAERVAAAAPWQTVAVRFAGIYGPGRIRLIRAVRDRAGPVRIDRRPRYLNQIHRDDCAGVLCHVLEAPDPAPVYLACDDEPAPRLEVLRWIARRIGLPDPVTVDGPADPYAGSARGNKRCRNDRLRASGYRLRVPTYREGYEQVIAAMEAAGTLFPAGLEGTDDVGPDIPDRAR